MSGFSLTCALWIAITVGAPPEARTYTDTNGKSLTGTFVKLEDENVTIRMESGEVTFPITRLAISDRLYVRAQARAVEAAAQPADASEEDNAATPLKTNRLDELDREWTDHKGQKIKAKFIRIHNGNVVLLKSSLINVPFTNLSADDQQFVRDVMESRGQGDLVPAVEAIAEGSNQPNNIPGAPIGAPLAGTDFEAKRQQMLQEMEVQRRKMAEQMAPAASPFNDGRPAAAREFENGAEARRIAEIERAEQIRQRMEEAELQRRESQLASSSIPPNNASQNIAPPSFTPPPTPEPPPIPVAIAPPVVTPPSIPIPDVYEGYVCESCNKEVTTSQARGSTCPHCAIVWNSKPPELPQPVASSSWGNWSSSGSSSSGESVRISGRAIKGLIGLVIIVLGVVARFFNYLTGNSSE